MLTSSLSELKSAIASLHSQDIILAYSRVSTDLPTQDTSLERQTKTYQKMGANIIVVERESARDIDRPLYKEIIRLINVGKIQKIITSRCDRLLRNAAEQEYFYRLCTELKVAWHFTDQPELNPDSPVGREMRSQSAYDAQKESDRLARRIERAYAFAEEEGRTNTRIHPLGYRANQNKHYEIDWIEPNGSNLVGYLNDTPIATGELARYLVNLYLEEQAIYRTLKRWKHEIVLPLDPVIDAEKHKRLLKFTDNALTDWLLNPILQGHTAYGKYKRIYYGEKLEKSRFSRQPPESWRIAYNTHPEEALVDYQASQSIKKYLELNSNYGHRIAAFKHQKRSHLPASLSPILRCYKCGQSYKISTNYQNNNRYASYYCQGRWHSNCDQKGLSEKKIIMQLIPEIIRSAEEICLQIERSLSGEESISPRQIEILKEEAVNTLEKYKITGITEYAEINRKLEAKIKSLENIHQKEIENNIEREKLNRAIASIEFWHGLNPVDLNRYLREMVKACWIEDRQVVKVDLNL